MTPTPVAAGMHLCDQVIIEEGTKKVSIIGAFEGMGLAEFPGTPSPFFVFSALTDAVGLGRIQVSVTKLDTYEEVYSRAVAFHFADRLQVCYFKMRLMECRIPAPGWYLFAVFVDGEPVCHRRLRVYQGVPIP